MLLLFAENKLDWLHIRDSIDEERWLSIFVFLIKAKTLSKIYLLTNFPGLIPAFLDLAGDNPNLRKIVINVEINVEVNKDLIEHINKRIKYHFSKRISVYYNIESGKSSSDTYKLVY